MCIYTIRSGVVSGRWAEYRKYPTFYLDSVRNELESHKPYRYFVKKTAKIAYETLEDQENGYFRGRAEIYTLIADLIEYVEYVIHSNVQIAENEMDLVMKFFDLC